VVDDSDFESDGVVNVAVTLTNTGAREGSSVVQLYVSDAEASAPRPAKELKAFAKVKLEAGASTTVSLALDARSFAFFDTHAKVWLVEAGAFTIHVGLCSTDLPLQQQITRKSALTLPL